MSKNVKFFIKIQNQETDKKENKEENKEEKVPLKKEVEEISEENLGKSLKRGNYTVHVSHF